MKYLEGKNIKLTKFTERHVTAQYMSWLNDHEVNRYMFAGRLPLSREEVYLPDGRNSIRFAIFSNLLFDASRDVFLEDNEYTNYIGTASINTIDWIARRAEIGYMIGEKKYWGDGLATNVVSLLTDY